MSRPEVLDYHLARLLILLRHFGPRTQPSIVGLTKIAKLDFLLRYPVFTDKLLAARSLSWPLGAEPTPAEFEAVESRMIRHKYGPWDNLYYPIIGSLVGMGMAETAVVRRALSVRLTELGVEVAGRLSNLDEWQIVDERAEMLRSNFDLSGNRLKEMIYSELPEAVDRPRRSII